MTRTPPCVLVIACTLLAACGKKGPPLAPISHIPAGVDKIAVTRMGDDMYVSLTVPSKNIDGSVPADVARLDVYGVTAITPPSANQLLQVGTRVASVPVARPPLKGEAPKPTREPAQGAVVWVHDALSAADLEPKALPLPPGRRPVPPAPTPPAALDEAPVPQRYYIAFAFSERGRPGPPGTSASMPLLPLPEVPRDLRITYTGDTLTLRWDPISRPGAAPAAPAAAAIGYNVYRLAAPDPLEFPQPAPPAWSVRPPLPANMTPLAMPPYTEPPDFDHRTCFVVRSVRGTGPAALESVASERVCATPVDTFPPAPPKSLAAVPAEGSISLIWEPNSEPDLDGYVVLRGEAGSATLQPLTAMPVAEAQFTDRTVKSGVRYVYAVVAVDNRLPVPNVSAESNRVEETAR